MKIEVTMDHITRGVPCDDLLCPIALAILDACGQIFSVRSQYARRRYNNVNILMWLPPQARMFISDYDSGKPVKPFTFELRKVKR